MTEFFRAAANCDRDVIRHSPVWIDPVALTKADLMNRRITHQLLQTTITREEVDRLLLAPPPPPLTLSAAAATCLTTPSNSLSRATPHDQQQTTYYIAPKYVTPGSTVALVRQYSRSSQGGFSGTMDQGMPTHRLLAAPHTVKDGDSSTCPRSPRQLRKVGARVLLQQLHERVGKCCERMERQKKAVQRLELAEIKEAVNRQQKLRRDKERNAAIARASWEDEMYYSFNSSAGSADHGSSKYNGVENSNGSTSETKRKEGEKGGCVNSAMANTSIVDPQQPQHHNQQHPVTTGSSVDRNNSSEDGRRCRYNGAHTSQWRNAGSQYHPIDVLHRRIASDMMHQLVSHYDQLQGIHVTS